jgi:glycosyltransferase involved in cell wall biosynthesis
VLAASEETKKECARTRAINLNKIIVMPNGIPLEQFKPLSIAKCQALRRRWRIPLDSPVIGTITRFHEEKGNCYLIDAATEIVKVLPNVRFMLVGDGPLLDKLQKSARRLGIEKNVIFAGFQSNVAKMLSIFDLKVIASIAEGHPQVLLEAMAMGKPIVATRAGGVKEILKDRKTGLIVPPRDPHKLAEKIIYLLQNEQFRIRIGALAHEESRRYSLSLSVKRLEKVYKIVKARGNLSVLDR